MTNYCYCDVDLAIDNKQDFLAAADRYGVGHAGTSLWYWIERGCTPGGFLSAVLCNDLARAVSRADGTNVDLIPNYVRLLHNHAPAECWGSEQNFHQWPYEIMSDEEVAA